MSDRATTQRPEKSFAFAVRTYERRTSGKFHALMPHKKGIAELRAKQASFRTIANLLKQAGVEVSHDTVARFCHQMLQQTPQRKPSRSAPSANGTSKPGVASLLKAQRDTSPPQPSTPTTRSKGPRIADPKNV